MKRTAASKRTAFPRGADYTKTFQKDWDRLSASGRYDMYRLKEVMLLLIANDGPLPAEWDDHPLNGNYAGFRECHVGGDFLLIYEIVDQGGEAVIFTRAGTHSELFKR